MNMKRESGRLTIGDLASKMSRLKVVGENLSEEERASYIQDLYKNTDEDVDYELFLKVRFFFPIFFFLILIWCYRFKNQLSRIMDLICFLEIIS